MERKTENEQHRTARALPIVFNTCFRTVSSSVVDALTAACTLLTQCIIVL